MPLSDADLLYAQLVAHHRGCGVCTNAKDCPTASHLLQQWGRADEFWARAQLAIDVAEGCWGAATDWLHDDRFPDVGERSL